MEANDGEVFSGHPRVKCLPAALYASESSGKLQVRKVEAVRGPSARNLTGARPRLRPICGDDSCRNPHLPIETHVDMAAP